VLLAKIPVGRLEPTLFPFERLGVTPTSRWSWRPLFLFRVHSFTGLELFCIRLDLVSLGAELEHVRLEPGHRGFELGRVHREGSGCLGFARGLGRSGHVFYVGRGEV